ncbi:MAG: FAD-dependent monooxygenase [Pseudomonadota bacterium]
MLIVGAGPTGLVLAIELARRGVPHRLVDRLPMRLGWERAIFVKPRTLEVLRAIGVADALLARSQIIDGVDVFYGPAKSGGCRFAGLDTPYPFIASVPQDVTEGVLIQRLHELGGAVERDVEFVALQNGEDGVRVQLRNGGGEEQWCDTSWLVGTDGLHSAVRHAIDIEFDGRDYARLWGVFDSDIPSSGLSESLATVQLEPPVVLQFPLQDGRRRIYFQTESAHPDTISDVLHQIRVVSPEARFRRPDQPHFFHAHSRIARRFGRGRVLLAGDAAHVSNPIEGHGMNAGIQDAHNLGWKLALIAGGASPDLLVGSYDDERRKIARELIESGDAMEARIDSAGSGAMAALLAGIGTAEGQEVLALAESELALEYDPGPIVREWEVSPRVPPSTRLGLRVANCAGLVGVDGAVDLYDLIAGPDATLLALLGETDPAAIDDALRCSGELPTWGWFGPRHFAVVRGSPPDVHVRAGVVYDRTGETHARLSGTGPTFCLVRPDGHIAFRCGIESAGPLAGALRAILPPAA